MFSTTDLWVVRSDSDAVHVSAWSVLLVGNWELLRASLDKRNILKYIQANYIEVYKYIEANCSPFGSTYCIACHKQPDGRFLTCVAWLLFELQTPIMWVIVHQREPGVHNRACDNCWNSQSSETTAIRRHQMVSNMGSSQTLLELQEAREGLWIRSICLLSVYIRER